MKAKKLAKKLASLLMIWLIVILGGCNSTKTLKGGAVGAGAGGAIGGVIGSGSDNTAKGVIFGAMIGGAAGALIGKYMDMQTEELQKDLEGAEVERIGEGIKITFDSGILFGFDSSQLTEPSKKNIEELAKVLNKYDDTEILIEGHTDSKGAEGYNQKLSEERAKSVVDQLTDRNVANKRFTIVGHGEAMPIADNATEEGRRLNRRVEVAIYANKKLKKAAEKGDIGEIEK
ncbi:OmpA family protein [Saccharicrinis carchari]|nr:OmpA family protein [Saccharicrinis carchari]